MTTTPTLIAADIGNVNTKFRRQGGAWEIEPSLVRMLSGHAGYSFTNDAPVRPLVYLGGPAGIEPHAPYLVGRDAQRAGVTDVAVIGSAELRVHSPAYLLLHLYAIVAEPIVARQSATASGTATGRGSARSRRRDHSTWRDQMLGEVFFFLVGLGVWLSNAIFTVLGVTTPVGLTPLTGLLGFIFHLLLSRAELYLWHRWRDPWYLLLLVGCVLIDAGTTLVGLLPLAVKWLPILVGNTPQNVLDWGQIVTVLAQNTAPPAWWPNALLLIAVAFAFALGSERLLRRFYRGMVETWQERPG